MKKRLLALLMASAMVVSLCACGNGGTQTPDPTPTAAVGGEETPAPTDAPATPTPVPVEEFKFTGSPTLEGNVEDRIPVKEDVFVSQVDATGKTLEIGTYGGTINPKPVLSWFRNPAVRG